MNVGGEKEEAYVILCTRSGQGVRSIGILLIFLKWVSEFESLNILIKICRSVAHTSDPDLSYN